MINAFSFKLLLKSAKKRTYDVINSEYDLGGWSKDVTQINFESRAIHLNANSDIIVNYNNTLVKCRLDSFEKNYNSMLVKLLSDYIEDSVVEMGCGLGVNLFLLHKAGFKSLEGYDLSKNAITRAKQYSEKNQMSIDFGVYDLNQPFTKNMIDGKVVFTHQCLEQCTLFMPAILKNLVNGKPKIVINFEVDYPSSSSKVKRYMNFQGYQNNLVSELKKLENQNQIEIISIMKLPLSYNSFNTPSMIIWKVK
jgi:SAM-dependent methyltransferase